MSIASGLARLKQKHARLSHRPGVYRMLDKAGKVLYVGKAKDLSKRVSFYTQFDRLPVRLQRMVAQVDDLVVVETASEAEAFLLENALIKKYKPYYNILLKDDKSFPFLCISNDSCPRIFKYRGKQRTEGQYFGPYASAEAVHEVLLNLQKIFGLRSCKNSVFSNRTRPCLLYQIKRCSAPCTHCISQQDYLTNVAQAKDFLAGKSRYLQDLLKKQMQQASAQQHYEQALALRNKIALLNHIQAYADTQPTSQLDADFMALYRQGKTALVHVLFYRHGNPQGTHDILLEHLEDMTDGQLLEQVIGQFYQDIQPPHTLFISPEPENVAVVEQALTSVAGYAVKVQSHPKQARKHLLEQAEQNAKNGLLRTMTDEQTQKMYFDQLAELFGLPGIRKIEVYDNSHLQGTAAVGAMIAATSKGFQKSLYRRYNIQRAATNDDFAMMREVLARRLIHTDNLPELMFIDGGKGQIHAVEKVLGDLPICIVGVAKGEERNAGNEVLYTLTQKEPIVLEHNSPLLFFIQRLRDEAHRFAIGSHRAKRSREQMHEWLKDIPGIGAKKQKALLQHFGSVKAVQNASMGELQQVPMLSEKNVKNIYTFFHKDI